MELIKKTLPVKEANGWYLTQDEYRRWTEDFTDEETNEVMSAEITEILCRKGTQLNDIFSSLLEENGIQSVRVSNIPVFGSQEKYMNLWETVLKIISGGGRKKRSYIVSADSPSASETFISEWMQMNVDGTFEIVKTGQVDYEKVIKLYDTEREAYEEDIRCHVKWYKCQIHSMIDEEDGESTHNAGSKNILVQATGFENAIVAVNAVMNRNEFDATYNTFRLLQELTVSDVFLPDEKASYYSNEEIGASESFGGRVKTFFDRLNNMGVTADINCHQI
jgi:hypothetical protein